jgi:hypothetical protein
VNLKKRIAAMVFVAALLSIAFPGPQSLASSSLINNQCSGWPQTSNPHTYTAFGQYVRIKATRKGLQLSAWGFKNNGELNSLGFFAQGAWDPAVRINTAFNWKGAHYTTLVKLTKPDDYRGFVSFFNPVGGAGKSFNFTLILPQYGSSKLAFTTSSMPPAHIGDHYSFTLLVKGGTPPYTFYLVYNTVKGLVLTRVGPNAGLLSGVPVQQTIGGYNPVSVIVWDKIHHAAIVNCVINLSS